MITRRDSSSQFLCLALTLVSTGCAFAETQPVSIPFLEIRARATADDPGDALAVAAIADGVRLRCGFQKLDGQATTEGLWLASTEPGGSKLRLLATTLGRVEIPDEDMAGVKVLLADDGWGAAAGGREPDARSAAGCEAPVGTWPGWSTRYGGAGDPSRAPLSSTGTVSVVGKRVRFIRAGVTEEYSVGVDGVRQDFVISERPAGAGDLRVELALSGARAEAAAYGAKLTLEGSGRALAYSRLRVTDATGQELTADLEVLAADRLAVRVADANATYPVRIDPTFSDADWVSLNPGLPGANKTVRAMAMDGSGNLYVGGDFTFMGTLFANRIAKWNGSAWSALGSGMDNTVRALAVSGTNLYAGGNFTSAGGTPVNWIAKWDGSTWSALGLGMNSTVYALAVSGTNLYAGGPFTTAGGVTAKSIAKWDGSNWSALDSGMGGVPTPHVYALAVNGTNLYAGGDFATAGGVAANRIAKWDGSTWSALGSGLSNSVYALAVSGTNLYAGGLFTTAGGVAASYIAEWNGSAWSALGLGMNGVVRALAASGTALYAGGDFTVATNTGGAAVSVGRIAQWDGSAWSGLGSGMDGIVNALVVTGTDLHAGGWFWAAGGVPANYIAKWDGSAWLALGAGMNSTVRALAVSGTNLYAGGAFTAAGGVTANSIAKWDGRAWSALGLGMNSIVHALAASGTNLYAGGDFTVATNAGGAAVRVDRVAKWDGNAWSGLGLGMNSTVYALALSGTNLYAGGDFTVATNAGGAAVSVNRIAQWDGNTWSALGSGMGGVPGPYVHALALSGTNLYAGGDFATAGAVPAGSIAKWDGHAWSALGAGMSLPVIALAVSGTDLYAGGYFAAAGGVSANSIAKWDGHAWSALGAGMSSTVRALAVNGTDLYAGGYFTMAGGMPANRIAKWDSRAWSALGAGMNDIVGALAADEMGHLFVGGYFYLAGTNVSPFIALANLIPPGGVIRRIRADAGAVTLDFLGRPGFVYAVQRATDVQFTENQTTLLTTNAPPDGLFSYTDPGPPTATAFYRLLRQ